MMVGFTGKLPEIVNHTKTLTTRLDAKGYFIGRWVKGMRKLDPWWGGQWWPMERKYKIGIVDWNDCRRTRGHDFTAQDAHRDGFDSLWDYKVTLANHHGMTVGEVNDWTWTQIGWTKDGWREGPNHPPDGHHAWQYFPEGRRVA